MLLNEHAPERSVGLMQLYLALSQSRIDLKINRTVEKPGAELVQTTL